MSVRFDDKVVIVTGAGNGLGRCYAHEFAKRGARVVVNDLGGSFKGEGASTKAADVVVDEIKANGGQAVANYDSVEFGDRIVQTAIDTWGRVDVVINNAGILRDVSFAKMKENDWDLIMRVHMKGAYSVTRAAWPHFRKQRYGRVVCVTSAAGLYGNFGQANYSAAKLGIVGLANTLSKEGASRNIHVNVIAPLAGSRMTETVMPAELVAQLKPAYVAPLVQWLSHQDCDENGAIFEVGAGWIARVRLQRQDGIFVPLKDAADPDNLRSIWDSTQDWTKVSYPTQIHESVGVGTSHLNSQGASAQLAMSAASVDVQTALSHKFPSETRTWTNEDTIGYAISVGAGAENQTDPDELKFTYEGAEGFTMLPTQGVCMMKLTDALSSGLPGIEFNPMMLLHAEQYLEIHKPLGASGRFDTNFRIGNVYDKKKAAVVTLEAETRDEQGDLTFTNVYTMFIRGIGGFGGDRGPKAPKYSPPQRAPDAVISQFVPKNQALLYRLFSGDGNPLHASPMMAAMGGFETPILHGLCFFGYAGRAILKAFCNNDPNRFKAINVRFTGSVYPGETLVTKMWKVSPTRVIFVTGVKERPAKPVLSNAYVDIVAGSSL